MSEITTALQRIRVLAIQSQNGINSSSDRLALQKEVSALKTEISRVATTTQFGGVDILTGGYSAAFLVGANAGQTISVNISRNGGYGFSGLTNGTDLTVVSASGASAALTTIDSAISIIASAARSRIRDTDFATETAQLTRWQIIQQASTTVLSQANQRPQAALSLLG